ncbi:MAG: hypothetical protein LBB52_00915, partial [Desulfovibrio sp.]|nr:hypothetical protein [Desulfovibrio sp.]
MNGSASGDPGSMRQSDPGSMRQGDPRAMRQNGRAGSSVPASSLKAPPSRLPSGQGFDQRPAPYDTPADAPA